MTRSKETTPHYDMWAFELSPFALKLAAMLVWARVPHRWLPRDGTRLENWKAAFAVERAKRGHSVVRHGGASELDEFPQVPFLIGPDRSIHYDSSALGDWIDETHPPEGGALVPDDPVLDFLTRLIDEAFDEFGLYMVHHNRWVLAAVDNGAGGRLASEASRFLPPGGPALVARLFPRRQVRRLPYLFSVANDDFDVPLPPGITPPAREGFPSTHELLDEAWYRYLDGMEALLERQPYLLGGRFSLADASAYGQLSMNLSDHSAAIALADRAPRTHAWLSAIRDHGHLEDEGTLELSDALRPLLDVIGQTFIPLMRQNEAAYLAARARGESLFNEPAFDRGRALYDGELMGYPFRSVVKTFQVRTWSDLRHRWEGLSSENKRAIDRWIPNLEHSFESTQGK